MKQFVKFLWLFEYIEMFILDRELILENLRYPNVFLIFLCNFILLLDKNYFMINF